MASKTNTLEEMCELIVDCPHSTPKWTDDGIIVLRNQNIRNGVLDLSSPSYTNEEDYKKRIKRAIPRAGDIVFTREAPMGEVCMIPDGVKCCLGQRQVLLRPRSEVSGKYLFWALQSPKVQHQISWNEGTGTTVSNVRIPVLKSLQIPRLNELEVKVAGIMSSLADKIELNKKINQTLEQMAQAMFKSWFVDFDPVFDNLLEKHNNNLEKASTHLTQKGAEDLIPKLQQRHQIQQTSDYKPLSDHIKKEFPSDFQHHEGMGWIPEGWMVSPLTKLIEVNPKLKLSKGKIAKYADMKSLPTSGYIADNVITKEYKGGAKFELEDVLIARITPCLENGKTAIVDFLSKDEIGFGSTEFIVLRGKDSITMPFVACLARNESFREHCIQNMVGSSGRQRVQNSCFDNFCLAIPKSKKELINFHKLTEPMFKKMSSLSKTVRDLNLLKDTLLPKLINGELSIRM